MSDKSLAEKMHLKAGKSVAFVHVPEAMVIPLPDGVTLVGEEATADVLLVFIADRDDAQATLPGVKARLHPGGALWAAFRKGNATDINRDSLFHLAAAIGLQPCANVSVDDTWSALRLKVVG